LKASYVTVGEYRPMSTKATEFREITQSNGHYAVHDHSRSQILVAYESKAARLSISDYLLILCCTVSKLWLNIGQIFAIATS